MDKQRSAIQIQQFHISDSAMPQTDGEQPTSFKGHLVKEEQSYERLLEALRDMQAQIEERVRPVAEQVVQAEIARLRSLSEEHRSALSDCLAHIDQSILSCRAQLDQYQQTRSNLAALTERLRKLGAHSESPPALPAENLKDLILARVEGLRADGKL
jgi:chromosome segregation ATPase